MRHTEVHYPAPTEADVERARKLYQSIGGPNIHASSKDLFEILSGEFRLRSELIAHRRLLFATWVLTAATVVLAVATVALIFATANS